MNIEKSKELLKSWFQYPLRGTNPVTNPVTALKLGSTSSKYLILLEQSKGTQVSVFRPLCRYPIRGTKGRKRKNTKKTKEFHFQSFVSLSS